MNKLVILCSILLFFTSCDNTNRAEIDFFESRWVSDSIIINGDESEREFLFIDSFGEFSRTTWWKENYILDEGELIKKSIKSISGDEYKIEVLDSINIILRKEGYEGFFTRDPMEPFSSFEDDLRSFVVGDSLKQLINGKWYLDVIKMEVDTLYELSDKEIPIHLSRYFSKIGTRCELRKETVIEFTKDNFWICSNDKGEKSQKYRFIIDEDDISLRTYDVIVRIPFTEISMNQMILKRTAILGEFEWVFRKIE